MVSQAHVASASTGTDPVAAFLSSFGEDWSRPHQLSGLVKRLQGGSVHRLMTVRFQALVSQLKQAGLEVQLQDGTPVDAGTESPGVHAKVRIRRTGPVGGAGVPSDAGARRVAKVAESLNQHPSSPTPTRGLLILKPYLDLILAGTKTWELRSRATALRGPIALIQSKSGTVVGTCDLVGVEGPLSSEKLRKNAAKAGLEPDDIDDDDDQINYAWVFKNARRLEKPLPYRHPSGAVIWVKLEPEVVQALQAVRRST